MTYVADIDKGLPGGGQFTSFVFKHNCLSPFLFCDRTTLDAPGRNPTCQLTKKVGKGCSFDEECESVSRDVIFHLLEAGSLCLNRVIAKKTRAQSL
jgi:hypothetical protein